MLNAEIVALSLSGAGITTAYQAGQSIPAGRASKILVAGRALTAAGSASTSAQWKLQGSATGTSGWVDLPITDLELVIPVAALFVSKATGVSADVGMFATFDNPMPFVRVAAKNTGGAGIAGETLGASIILQ